MEPLDLKLDLPKGHKVLGFETLGSTSDLAKEIGDEESHSEVDHLWIWTREQTSGRGRRGREWISRQGNLTTTVLLRPDCEPSKGAELTFVAALAIADLVAAYVGDSQVELKWPNDVLVSSAKIAGILLESSAAPGATLDWLSIGMGVNLAFHPDQTIYPATNLKNLGCEVEALDALESLVQKFDFWKETWIQEGFVPIRSAWLSKAKGLGEPIVARLANDQTEGTFEDLDPSGNLIIRLRSGDKRLISAGEVYFP